MLLLSPLLSVYSYTLQPIPPFSWFGSAISTLDVVAAFRLCIALRQIRDQAHKQHVATQGANVRREARAFLRDAANTLLVVYGGEAIVSPWLGVPPSFMVSGTVPLLYIFIQAIVEFFPSVPIPALDNELPLAVLDGFTRSYLLCSLIPPSVTGNPYTVIATSPWALLLSSLLTANTGFFITSLTSSFSPGSLSLTTPPELLPYGWTATDLWCAPLITGIYAFLTHAQPFWADLHALMMNAGATDENVVPPMTPEQARAFCAAILAGMFTTRAVKNFAAPKSVGKAPTDADAKEKTQ